LTRAKFAKLKGYWSLCWACWTMELFPCHRHLL